MTKNIINSIANLFNRLINKIILFKYQKKFENFNSAKLFCEKYMENSYNNEYLNKFRLNKFKNNIKIIPYTFNNSLFALLEAVSLYFFQYNKLPKILDFGGIFAENKLYLENLYNLKIVYDVVETKNVCDLAKEFNHCNFFANLEEAFLNNNKYDIIFSSGTIQYFEKPYNILNKIFSQKIKYIVFTRTNLSNDEGVYSAASFLAGHGSSEGYINYNPKKEKKIILVPNTQIKEEKLLNISSQHSYKLVRSFSGISGSYGKNSYTKDFIFKRFTNESNNLKT